MKGSFILNQFQNIFQIFDIKVYGNNDVNAQYDPPLKSFARKGIQRHFSIRIFMGLDCWFQCKSFDEVNYMLQSLF